jgi:hypothetical protein
MIAIISAVIQARKQSFSHSSKRLIPCTCYINVISKGRGVLFERTSQNIVQTPQLMLSNVVVDYCYVLQVWEPIVDSSCSFSCYRTCQSKHEECVGLEWTLLEMRELNA